MCFSPGQSGWLKQWPYLSHVKMSRTLTPAKIMLNHHRRILSLYIIFLLVLTVWPAGFDSAFPRSLAKSLRVMTYNIHVGVGMDKKLDLQRIADVVIKEKPDQTYVEQVLRRLGHKPGKGHRV
jgi:hypothetical protein